MGIQATAFPAGSPGLSFMPMEYRKNTPPPPQKKLNKYIHIRVYIFINKTSNICKQGKDTLS